MSNNASRGSSRGAAYGKSRFDYAMENGASQFLKCSTDVLMPLLDVDEPWTVRDVPIHKGELSAAMEKNIIHQVGETSIEKEPHGQRTIKTWRLSRAARERLRDRREANRPALLPCGHAGFVNERGVEGVSCKTCEATFSKEEVR